MTKHRIREKFISAWQDVGLRDSNRTILILRRVDFEATGHLLTGEGILKQEANIDLGFSPSWEERTPYISMKRDKRKISSSADIIHWEAFIRIDRI